MNPDRGGSANVASYQTGGVSEFLSDGEEFDWHRSRRLGRCSGRCLSRGDNGSRCRRRGTLRIVVWAVGGAPGGQPGFRLALGIRLLISSLDHVSGRRCSDGDGTISLEEWQAAHAKIFKAMDADKDGTVSFEEMMNFFRGTARSAPHQ